MRRGRAMSRAPAAPPASASAARDDVSKILTQSVPINKRPRAAASARTAPAMARRWWTIAGPLLAVLLSFAAWQPFARPDFDLWRSDDGEAHLLKLYVFERAVRAGEWFPHWVPDLFLGFGYPV